MIDRVEADLRFLCLTTEGSLKSDGTAHVYGYSYSYS